MNEKEAELIGMHAGDGTLYLAGKTLVWELRGSVNEKEYYSYVSSLLNSLFKVEVNPKYRGPTSYGVQTTKKEVTSFFIETGFKPGRKTYTVSIPEFIKSGDVSLKKAFIRGLFDTDGCIRFDKNRTAFHYYPKIELSTASKDLAQETHTLLIELGFKPYKWESKRFNMAREYRLGLAGFDNLKKWLAEIRPSNQKHLNRAQQGLKVLNSRD